MIFEASGRFFRPHKRQYEIFIFNTHLCNIQQPVLQENELSIWTAENRKMTKTPVFRTLYAKLSKIWITLQVMLQGKIEGQKGPGRCKISWLDNRCKWFGATSIELFRRKVNKSRIAMMVADVRNGKGTLRRRTILKNILYRIIFQLQCLIQMTFSILGEIQKPFHTNFAKKELLATMQIL